MRAGPLRHRITIEQSTSTQSDIGEWVPAWSAFINRSAEVRPLRGREYQNAKAEFGEVTHSIFMRHDAQVAQITNKMRVNYNYRIFQIVAPPINHGERNRMVELMVIENTADND